MLLYNEGRSLIESGDIEIAIDKLKLSVHITPHFKVLELLGECFLKVNKPIEAIIPLAAATALNSQVRAPALLAHAFLQCGEYSQAIEFASSVLKKAPRNKMAKMVMESNEIKKELSRSKVYE
jgi:tetratricopeptide (TPR) repeat protein